MKKIYIKLAASILSIVMAFTMVVGATYAWMVLSKSPVAEGISVSVGGGRTIMLAADYTKTITDENGNEVVAHYPGQFGNTLNFSNYENYDYLSEVGGLSPVSTSDGQYWILPDYEEETGELKRIDQFQVDGSLAHANVADTGEGNYIYLDFWVVSPGKDYNLRVSTDIKKEVGSYLIELPGVEEDERGLLQLADEEGIVESAARVGFLVNGDAADEETYTAYSESEHYEERYKSLQGIYQEKGKNVTGEYQFSIYEPNALQHPSELLNDGDYIITTPLGYNPYGNSIAEENIDTKLMIQGNNTWVAAKEESLFKQIFQASIANKGNLTPEEAKEVFYQEYLQGQISTYVKSAPFFQRTDALYAAAVTGTVSAESMNIAKAGATDDVIITGLQANVPQRIRMFIWLEGQDIDCHNTASVVSSGFCLNLEFSGADQ